MGLIPVQTGKIIVFDNDITPRYNKLYRASLGYVAQKTVNRQFPVIVKEAVAIERYDKVGRATTWFLGLENRGKSIISGGYDIV